MRSFRLKLAAAAALAASALGAHAGPFIIAGTDADDHGFASATGNQEGWLFMQRALENLASSAALTTPNKKVVALGSDVGSTAALAAESAFSFSSLAGAGWSFELVTDVNAFFAGGINSAGIIMLDSGGNVGGGLDGGEQATLAANAVALNNFVGNGGGLFSQANGYSWLSALLPAITVNCCGDIGLALTPAGQAAFPGLTNADLSSGPWHADFTNVGSLPVLAMGVGASSNLNVIIGAASGSITDPGPVNPIPEPSTYALMALGLAALGWAGRRRNRA